MIQLSICVVNWNTKDLLERCLLSIYESTKRISFEIIVVDNASSDDSVLMVKTKFPEIILIENKENYGFARANNQAIRISRGKYVLLLNSDTIVLSGALDVMVDFMEKTAQAGACGPKLLNPDGSRQRSAKTFPSFYTELVDQLRFNFPPFSKLLSQKTKTIEKYLNKNGIIDVDVLSAACFMVRREAIDQVGLMNEDFFLFSEENDWCLRMEKHGWMRYHVPKASVIHLVGESMKKLRSHLDILAYYESRVKYFKKHMGNFSALIMKQMYISFFCWRIMWNILMVLPESFSRKNPKRRCEHIASCLNIAKRLRSL